MRKIVLDLAVTIDGFIEGANGEIDWCIMDDDMNMEGFMATIDTIFYGRVSYDMWGNYYPEGEPTPAEKFVWDSVRSMKKYVFSSIPREDGRAIFITSDIAQEVDQIKRQDGKDIWLYGGSKLIETFVNLDLIDIYRLSVHPVVLGTGKPLFENLKKRLNLTLIEVNKFRSGVVELIYENKR